MTFDLQSIVRDNIWNLKPYSSARSEFKLYGETASQKLTLLDANENPQQPDLKATKIAHRNLNRYPDPLQSEVKSILSDQINLPTDQIFVGNGSDEAIDLIYRIFCEPGKDQVITCPPTYGMYEVSAAINNVKVIEVPLTPMFELDVDGIINNPVFESAKVLWICSPNNPTGNLLLEADIDHDWKADNYTKGGMMDMPFAPEFEAQLKRNRDLMDQLIGNFNGIVIVDEAYQHFTSSRSFINRIEDYPNLIVLQTMSKAHGLAGARVGFAFASSEIIGLFNKTKPPYNVNELSQQAVIEALQNNDQAQQQIEEIIDNREILAAQLQQLPYISEVYPSEANFILAKAENATGIYNYLKDNGIIIRNRSSQIAHTLRFTVGTTLERKQLIETLENYKG